MDNWRDDNHGKCNAYVIIDDYTYGKISSSLLENFVNSEHYWK